MSRISPRPLAAIAVAFVLNYENSRKFVEIVDDVPRDVATPAHAAFACAGQLPKVYEAFWAVAADRLPGLVSGPLHIAVGLGPGQLSWSVNRRTLIADRGETTRKKLARLGVADPPEEGGGSITIYAGEGEVAIDSVEVNGFLRDRWIEERLEALARAELAKLLADGAAAAKAAKAAGDKAKK